MTINSSFNLSLSLLVFATYISSSYQGQQSQLCNSAWKFVYVKDFLGAALCTAENGSLPATYGGTELDCLHRCVSELPNNCSSFTFYKSSTRCEVFGNVTHNYYHRPGCVSQRRAIYGKYNPLANKGDCILRMLAWGYNDSPQIFDGYVLINGDTHYNMSGRIPGTIFGTFRGTNLITFNIETCKLGTIEIFDTYGNGLPEANRLISYISTLNAKLVLLGIGIDEPHNYLSPAYPILAQLGIPLGQLEGNSFTMWAKFIFVAQLGMPEKTLFRIKKQGGGPLSTNVTLWGDTLDDVQFEEIL